MLSRPILGKCFEIDRTNPQYFGKNYRHSKYWGCKWIIYPKQDENISVMVLQMGSQ
jgi:hypothetical protein